MYQKRSETGSHKRSGGTFLYDVRKLQRWGLVGRHIRRGITRRSRSLLGRTQVVGIEEHTFYILTYASFIKRTSSVYNDTYTKSPGAPLSSLYKFKLSRKLEDMAVTITTNIAGRVILLEKSNGEQMVLSHVRLNVHVHPKFHVVIHTT